MGLKLYISELNGYLKALQRLSGKECLFGVRHFQLTNDDVDSSIIEQIGVWGETDFLLYQGKSSIKYRELISKVKGFVFCGILSENRLGNDNVVAYLNSVIIEDINEYYGLVSGSVGSDESFHPLVTGPVYLLDIDNRNTVESLYFLVQIGDQNIFTYFCRQK